MRRKPAKLGGVLLLSILLGAANGCDRAPAGQVSLGAAPRWDALGFDEAVIDERSGDVKMAGDIDGDGLIDLVIGGEINEGLVWYRAPNWRATRIAAPTTQFTTDAALGDVDGDGDLDIVTPDGPEGDNLVWYANPRPNGDPANGAAWRRNVVGGIGDWGKDVELADFDEDGRLDIATRSNDEVMIFFQDGGSRWSQRVLRGLENGREGMGSGDIDRDGDRDLVLRGSWAENPGGAKARQQDWQNHGIGPAPSSFKALVADIDQDGRADILFSSSEGVADVVRYTAERGDPRGKWRSHMVLPRVEKAHTLLAGDLDADGDTDLIVAQMHTSHDRMIAAVYNIDGRGGSWRVQIIGDSGLHNGVLADLGADGDLDLYGSNWVTNPPVRIWTNTLASSPARLRLDRWAVAAEMPVSGPACELSLDDIDGDGRPDAVCGRAWWRNPGEDLSAAWRGAATATAKAQRTETRSAPPGVPSGFTFLEAADVNHDSAADIIADGPKESPGLYILAAHGDGRSGLQQIAAGPDTHAAARAVDLDGDGDLDVIALVRGERPVIRILRNDAIRRE